MQTANVSDARDQILTLYADHHNWLLGYLRSRLGHACDAADLAHDAFVKLLSRPRGFDSPAGARAYLGAMANGMCVDLWRRRGVEQAWLDTLAARPEALQPSPEHQAIVLETLREVANMLHNLPPRVADAFILSRINGLTYAQIAEKLKVSERMVKKYMARAMYECALADLGGCQGMSAP